MNAKGVVAFTVFPLVVTAWILTLIGVFLAPMYAAISMSLSNAWVAISVVLGMCFACGFIGLTAEAFEPK